MFLPVDYPGGHSLNICFFAFGISRLPSPAAFNVWHLGSRWTKHLELCSRIIAPLGPVELHIFCLHEQCYDCDVSLFVLIVVAFMQRQNSCK